MTMHADEDTGLDLVAPNRKVRMVRIDDLFRVDLRILRTIVRHGDDHDVRNLSSRRRMESGRTWNDNAFSCTWDRRHSCTSLITHYNHWIRQDRDGGFLFIRDVVGYSGQR